MGELPKWANITIAITGGLGTIVTAIATVFLVKVTRTLARETTRMAIASSQPHVVATIDPNRWSMIHFDINVENSGNAPAYDIEIDFDPPIENGEEREEYEIPLKKISVLKPGHGISSYLTDYKSIKGIAFQVEISWKKDPTNSQRETNKYILNIGDQEGISRLGDDPIVQISKHVKKISESWSPAFKGSRKMKIDIFNSEDREKEHKDAIGRLEQQKQMSKAKNSSDRI